MEQSNIRWVELISATLIVVCSVGLVISLWSTLSNTSRFFPSLVFLIAIAAVHGAGQYTLRQWKLRATSRGILQIGLMLIPLAVLVGILLSRREEGPPRFDVSTWIAVAVGTLVYGSLAITASRALFSRRWPVVAAVCIASSLTLVPIYFLGEKSLLAATWAPVTLLPIVLLSMWAAMLVSLSSLRSARMSGGTAKRIAGIMVQCIFAAGVAFIFWMIESRSSGGWSSNAWLAIGLLTATWASWGWAAGSGHLSWLSSRTAGSDKPPSEIQRSGSEASWLRVAAWCLASICTLQLIAALWQTSSSRPAMAGLLGLVGLWWLAHGWVCRYRASLFAGALALIFGASLASEAIVATTTEIKLIDWLSFPRIALLTGMGLVCVVAGRLRRMATAAIDVEATQAERSLYGGQPRRPRLTAAQIEWQFALAGAVAVGVAGVLTGIASLVPIGSTPYGGNWAALMLLGYGALAIAGSVFVAAGRSNPLSYLMPVGQAVVLLASIRLCQTSPMFEEVLASLRPARAWGLGTAAMAVAWSLLAAGLRGLPRPRQQQALNIHWLCGGAIAAGTISSVAIWNWSERFELAAQLGWYLPLVTMAVFVAWRQSTWREISLLLLYGWLATLLYSMGVQRDWWTDLGWPNACAVFIALMLVTLSVVELAVEQWKRFATRGDGMRPAIPGRDRDVIANAPALASDPSAVEKDNWQSAGPHWASPCLLMCGWAMSLMTLTPTTSYLLNVSLGGQFSLDAEAMVHAGRLSPGLLLSVAAALAAVGVWLGRARGQWWLVNAVALLPIMTAMITAASLAPPYALVGALWVLAAWMLASELVTLLGGPQTSIAAWQQVLTQDASFPEQRLWLPLARVTALLPLLLGTGIFAVAVFFGHSAAELSQDSSLSWLANAARLGLTIGPALCVFFVRWGMSVSQGEPPNMMACSGALAGLLAGLLGALSLPPAWPVSAISFLQVATLVTSMLAWKTIGYATLRNFLGLKKMFGAKASWRELLPKAMKGNRWKQSEQASWWLVTIALGAVVMLSLGAAIVSVAYPAKVLPGMSHLGGALAMLAYVATVSLFWLQSARRGASRFGLLAITLGLAAPLVSASYASWLLADSTRSLTAAQDFEPFRLLLGLWLVTLGIGFAVRLAALRHSAALSPVGEALWLLLAIVVGGLGLISTSQDPNPVWACAELSLLAFIATLSGVASGQTWRGHVAAMLAAAGMCGWLFRYAGSNWLDEVWILLWGPTWVAIVSLAAQYVVAQRFERWQPSPEPTSGQAASHWYQTSVDQTLSLHLPVVSAVMSFAWVASQSGTVQAPSDRTGWIVALAAAGLALGVSRLWDPRIGKRGLSVYLNCLSLSLIATTSLCSLGELPMMQTWLLWMASGLVAMAVMAGLLRELVLESSRLGPALRLCAIADDPSKLRHALNWMPAVHAVAGLLALLPSILLVLTFHEQTLRVAATALPFVSAISILPIAIARGQQVYRYLGLMLISSSLVLLWWADLPSPWALASRDEAWIYLQRAFVALVMLGLVYPIIVPWIRHVRYWDRPLMHCGWIALGLGIASGMVMLLLQLEFGWETQAATATLITKLMTTAAWVAVVARLLQFAVRPHSIDRSANVELRQAAVWAAQLGLALLCAAVYFHFPDLFSGVFARWWPLIVFAIAMLSAGLGQWLQRLGQTIVADPVRQSSLLLPLIPLAGVWWIQPEGSAWLWRDWNRYALLLLTAASLYGLQGWLRQSVRLRAISAGFTLLSFWAFLHSQPNLQFLEHPQFWLLPPALATLVFVEINRRRLDASVVIAARYLAILVAYFSSTAEIFLKAFEGQLWQPLLLLILALAGVAAGIVLHVRAFLYSGAAFTLVALVGMVWHAQQAIGQVWPWWAFGIATGIGLIVLLGYFEKNRPQVLAYLEQLKQWEK